jgi:hypothetical protein
VALVPVAVDGDGIARHRVLGQTDGESEAADPTTHGKAGGGKAR